VYRTDGARPALAPAGCPCGSGYLSVDDHTGSVLAPFEVLWNDDDADRYRYRGWAAERPKRYLAGAVAVGTIDQVLLSALMVGHAHMRATALLRHLLVIDEVHASDAYMTRTTESVLAHHVAAGGHALLMSATLGAAAKNRLSRLTGERPVIPPLGDAIRAPYPAIVHREPDQKELRVALPTPDRPSASASTCCQRSIVPAAIAGKALHAATNGARVLVIRNTVRDCVATQQAVEDLATESCSGALLFRCATIPAPHHARYARSDRQLLDAAVEASFGKDSPPTGCVAVATQTVQQSLDLDADLMVTDLCPSDVLLQRIGRLFRHTRKRPAGFEEARVIVLVPSERDLEWLIGRDGTAHGDHGFGTVYDDLRVLEATWRQLEKTSVIEVPAMCRRLVEMATHPEALARIVHDLGGAWNLHARKQEAIRLSHGRLADLGLIDRGVPFDQVRFPSGELQQ